MSLEPAEIVKLVSMVFALLNVTSGVLVSLGPVPLQGEVYQVLKRVRRRWRAIGRCRNSPRALPCGL
jgi:hypothetical protein